MTSQKFIADAKNVPSAREATRPGDLFLMKIRTAFLSSASLVLWFTPPVFAQQSAQTTTAVATATVPADPFSISLGQTTQTADDTQTTYRVLATQPATSKLVGQKLRFTFDRTTPKGNATRLLTINTGQHKTVAQMTAFVGDIFRRFLAGPATAGQEFGKIGDVKYGGEIHFTADAPDSLSYQITTPAGPSSGSSHFDRADVQAFANILAGKTGN